MNLEDRFKHFGEIEVKDKSPLYSILSLQIAEDTEMIDICSVIPEGQPVANLLFASVKDLLYIQNNHPLKNYYPEFTKEVKVPHDSYPYFKDFVINNKQDVIQRLTTNYVQTNEVNRCAYLFPVLHYIYEKIGTRLSLIEIGTSAGLQLLCDQYAYAYNNSKNKVGNINSELTLRSLVREGDIPSFLSKELPIKDRVGIDLHVLNLLEEDDVRWLKSLVWPENLHRIEVLDKAIAQFNKSDESIRLIEADALSCLEELAIECDTESLLCIFHTHVANQLTIEQRHTLLESVSKIGKRRDVFHIYNNIWDGQLHVESYINGSRNEELKIDTHPHGEWFDWPIRKKELRDG
ncbi:MULTISPECIES: DUF2332 domain-containing protein [Oceanobacillus]|uniref:DUF2332 domain-containing protein n=1 Tax=Oceanobacillus TaxID=182709 RepID=UPI00084E90F4|nr:MULTISPECIES: DUF2332 domain-containing protein [Oceanobacillus]MBT2601238.1 DUF2332 domain-containing protein [Oceanobacillus sp. ISL-74]MBT2652463.1 DUF2332 domain-containing protein [Oceanobacillus sp. ISL-73]OEH54066.1 hypothetical protein AQ616_09785 [Oceanobacillus sp. E9]